MVERVAQRRKSGRRVFIWSLTLAAVLHVVVFLVLPGFREGAVYESDIDVEPSDVVYDGAIPLDLFFGPPAISNAAGGLSLEPPERVLEAERLVYLQAACRAFIKDSGAVTRGSVRLEVMSTGRVDVLGVVQSTGTRCGDDVLERVAGDLWYRWLPNDDFPAPVELIQPLSFAEKTGL